MTQTVYNTSTAHVSLLEGRILVPKGGSHPISAKEAEDPSVVHALRAGWVGITKPGAKTIPVSTHVDEEIKFTVDPMLGSDTIPEVEKKVEAISSLIGEVVVAKKSSSKKAQ